MAPRMRHCWLFATLGLALGLACTQDLVLPPPPGPYTATMTSEELVDTQRPDPWNASHPRRMMISRFTPILKDKCQSSCRVEYMPPLIASLEDAIGNAFLGNDSWPPGVLARVKLDLCCDAAPKLTDAVYESLPTVFLDTGLNTTRLFYSALAQHLASRGYHVITMDHPYETDVVAFPDGTTVYGGVVNRTSSTDEIARALEVRAADASFILDTLARSCAGAGAKAVFAGHSMGGAAAATAVFDDARIVGGVDFDGRMFGPVVQQGVSRANQSFLLVSAEESSEPSWDSLFNATSSHPGVWMKQLKINDTIHGSFWDFALIGDVSGLRSDENLVETLFGRITGARIFEILREYLDDYFQMMLKGAGEGLLAGPSADYPEVKFARSTL
jgi:hypothetical protein